MSKGHALRPRLQAEVAIVGFGPVGAVLAGLLGRRGVEVVVLEQDPSVFALPRAAHIDHTGLRILQELGLIDQLLPTMMPNQGLDFVTGEGKLLFRVPGSQPSVSGLPASMYFHQPDFDYRVRESASALPTVDVRLGCKVTALVTADEQSVLTVKQSDGEGFEVDAKFVVGCDGAWSAVREWSGIQLEDLHFEARWLVVDIIRDGPVAETGHAVCRCDARRPTYSIPMPSARHRFEFMLQDDEDGEQMRAPESVQSLITPWLPDEDISIERSAIYNFHGLLACDWRHGSVLIAGDAAHQMPPFLGQGMCSGLRDAANLAWKLDFVLHRGTSTQLLDSYEAERRAHVRTIIDAAIAFGQIICTVDPDVAAARDREMLSDSDAAARRMTFSLPPIAGELVFDGGGELFLQLPSKTGRRLDDLIGQRFAVIARDEEALAGQRELWETEIDAFVATLTELAPEAESLGRWLARRGGTAVVVRPDRYVLWTGSDLAVATRRATQLLGRDGVSASSQQITRGATPLEA